MDNPTPTNLTMQDNTNEQTHANAPTQNPAITIPVRLNVPSSIASRVLSLVPNAPNQDQGLIEGIVLATRIVTAIGPELLDKVKVVATANRASLGTTIRSLITSAMTNTPHPAAASNPALAHLTALAPSTSVREAKAKAKLGRPVENAERDAAVIKRLVDGGGTLTYADVGHEFQLSSARITQIASAARAKGQYIPRFRPARDRGAVSAGQTNPNQMPLPLPEATNPNLLTLEEPAPAPAPAPTPVPTMTAPGAPTTEPTNPTAKLQALAAKLHEIKTATPTDLDDDLDIEAFRTKPPAK